MRHDKATEYILSFLLGEATPPDISGKIRITRQTQEQRSPDYVAYCRPEEAEPYQRVVIVPSGFFNYEIYGRAESMPTLPLAEWHGLPLLFGTPREEQVETPYGTRLVIHADLVASSYFLLSRYEEVYHRELRDEHGRFPGKQSLPYRAGFLERPLVDEYAAELRRLMSEIGLAVDSIPPGFSAVALTHDLDQPYYSSGIRGFLRLLLKERLSLRKAYRYTFSRANEDLFFSYGRFLDWNVETQRKCAAPVRSIFFIKTPSSHPLDKPNYTLHNRKIAAIIRLARRRKVEFGLHLNLYCSEHPEAVEAAKLELEKQLEEPLLCSRHHYLAVREPEDYNALMAAGIYHDYSMAYADVAGFRLGTSRPVRFINPQSMLVTDLILHPLTVMDYTLHDEKYMNLDYAEAERVAQAMVEQAYKYHGEVTLLFHNENLLLDDPHIYHTRLYRALLRQIIKLSPVVEIPQL